MRKLLALTALLVFAISPAAFAQEGQALTSMPSFAPIVEKAGQAVVNISTVKMVKDRGGMPFPFPEGPQGELFDRFFGGGPNDGGGGEHKERSLGSGFIIDSEGYIITNNHVIEGADDITVKLTGGEEIHADIIGRDPKTDLALIKLKKAGNYPHIKLGDSATLKIGDWVLAIGNPFGLENTVTSGILSGTGRSIGSGPYDDFLQTDASINPGNSGGPLLNLAGDVIGINTAIVAGGTGIGFAIPANLATGVVAQLKDKGRVVRGWMGVVIQKITPEMAKGLKLNDERGALVGDIDPAGPAAAAGIERRDVIVKFDGKDIVNWQDLPITVASTPVGKKVDVVVVRGGQEKTIQLTVAEMKDDSVPGPGQTSKADLGLNLQDLTPQMAKRLGLNEAEGVLVAGVRGDSPASDAGVRSGDVIVEMDDQPVKSTADYRKVIAGKKTGDSVVLLIQRSGGTFFAAIEMP